MPRLDKVHSATAPTSAAAAPRSAAAAGLALDSEPGLQLAPDLRLSLQAATKVFALLGVRDSGKTYAAGKLVEELLAQHVQVVILDSVGNWYGLRLAADGHSSGLDIPVLGGLRGDVALAADAGELAADLVADTGRSFVLDLSQFSRPQRRRFALAFADRFWARKKQEHDPTPVHLVLEEAHLLLPQKASKGDRALVESLEEVVRLGRNYGIGLSLLSQRPQSIDKDVLSQTELLMAFKVGGLAERDTITRWVGRSQGKLDLHAELPDLEQGWAFLWSPTFLRTFRKVRPGPKRTFNASATPEVGRARPRGRLAPLDLEDVKLRMASLSVTPAGPAAPGPADPSAAARIVSLEREVQRLRSLPPRVERVEVPVVPTDLVKELTEAWRRAHQSVDAALERLRQLEAPAAVARPSAPPAPTRAAAASPSAPPRPPAAPGKLERGPQRILTVLAMFHPAPVGRVPLATLAGYRAGGGGFKNYLGLLRGRGHIAKAPEDHVALTAAGRALVAAVPRLPSSQELLALWLDKLTGKAKEMLRVLVDLGPGHSGLTRTELARRVEMDAEGGGFKNYLGTLGSNDLVVRREGIVRAAAVFFAAPQTR